jgi:CelD/BcsL family acetyltransferase involved in cellulose biosynthesis
MRVVRLSTTEELDQIAGPWNAMARGFPFRSHDWLASWWRFYGGEHRLCTLAVMDGAGQVVGVAPLYLERTTSRGRVLKLLGTGDACSDYLGVLAKEGSEEEVLPALAQWLVDVNADNATPDARWELLELSGVAADDALVAQLVGHMVEDGAQVHRREGANCWRIALPDSWDALLAGMSKSHRKQIRRVQRRLLDSGRAVLHTADESTLATAMETLIDLHQRRRQSLGQPGCFSSPAFTGFLHQTARRMLPSGQLELHWIELDGRAVAAEFHLVGGDVVFAYQAGVDPEALEEEPGRIINVATLRRAIELGRRGFDFLRGDEPYKAHWRAGPRGSCELRVVPSAASARLRHGVWLAGDSMKQLIKTGLNLTGMR